MSKAPLSPLLQMLIPILTPFIFLGILCTPVLVLLLFGALGYMASFPCYWIFAAAALLWISHR